MPNPPRMPSATPPKIDKDNPVRRFVHASRFNDGTLHIDFYRNGSVWTSGANPRDVSPVWALHAALNAVESGDWKEIPVPENRIGESGFLKQALFIYPAGTPLTLTNYADDWYTTSLVSPYGGESAIFGKELESYFSTLPSAGTIEYYDVGLYPRCYIRRNVGTSYVMCYQHQPSRMVVDNDDNWAGSGKPYAATLLAGGWKKSDAAPFPEYVEPKKSTAGEIAAIEAQTGRQLARNGEPLPFYASYAARKGYEREMAALEKAKPIEPVFPAFYRERGGTIVFATGPSSGIIVHNGDPGFLKATKFGENSVPWADCPHWTRIPEDSPITIRTAI